MTVLKAIGGFFARIWRWIKETAWVQPLLIVGAIFAIIFSIPSIVNGVSSWFKGGDSAYNYYSKFKVSLYGANEGKSDADGLFNYIFDREDGKATQDQINKYGNKFWVCFIQEDCSGCTTNYVGFEKLQQLWNTTNYQMIGDEPFKLYTIFIDETVSYDYKEKIKGEQMFDIFYDRFNRFFEVSSETVAEQSDYYTNMKGGDDTSDYATLLKNIELPDTFSSPTNYLIDFTNSYPGEYGIREIFFTLTGYNNGTTSYDYADRLKECWNHTGKFSSDWDGK